MANREKYYIAFYRFIDTKTWQRTQLDKDRHILSKYLESIQYIDKDSIDILEVYLPE